MSIFLYEFLSIFSTFALKVLVLIMSSKKIYMLDFLYLFLRYFPFICLINCCFSIHPSINISIEKNENENE